MPSLHPVTFLKMCLLSCLCVGFFGTSIPFCAHVSKVNISFVKESDQGSLQCMDFKNVGTRLVENNSKSTRELGDNNV